MGRRSKSGGGVQLPNATAGYYSFGVVDDGQLQSRKNSDASFLAHSGLLALQDHINVKDDAPRTQHTYHKSDASTSSLVPQVTGPPPSLPSGGAGNPSGGIVTPPPSEKATTGELEYLNLPDQVLYMQIFVEEVGVWMDSLDKHKHFSTLIPYHALKSPMLLNAFLSCGVKHLGLVNPNFKDDKHLHYYDTATTMLLRSLQNPDRNTAECATTAVVLNVYEIMSEKPAARMNHIAGARALIRECGWDARSTGIGAACFWLNIGMEVLSCLAFNWQTSWDPDQWGVDMEFGAGTGGGDASSQDPAVVGDEEIWVHRIFYIVARIANFRATIPKFQEASPHDEQVRLGNRLAQWQDLKRLCDSWNNCCPKTMHPFGYLYSTQTKSKSAFPNVWYVFIPRLNLFSHHPRLTSTNRLIKRAAVIGRLFYHTAQCLLAQTNPMEPPKASEEMRAVQLHHAHQICGIVAHSKDRGVASVAIRSLAIASCVLTEQREQEEVLRMLEKIHAETGWKLDGVHGELKKAWGWEVLPTAQFFSAPSGTPGQGTGNINGTLGGIGNSVGNGNGGQSQSQSQSHTPTQQVAPAVVSAPPPPPPQPVTAAAPAPVLAPSPMKPLTLGNPLSEADFSLPNHPYQNWYEPPNRPSTYSSQAFF
jgi:hypothetical protein